MINRLSIAACALLSMVAMAQTCAAQSNPWNGSWKVEPSSLHFTGSTFSVAVDANGFTTTRGGKAMPKVVCDGKPHQTPDNTMMSCTKSATGFTLAETKAGKPQRITTISISADGKKRTSTSKIFPSDGAPFTMTNVAERVSGGPGPAGQWKETSFSSSEDQGVLTIAVKGDSIDFKETDTPKPVTCKLDGSDTPVGMGGTMAVKLADPHQLKVTYKDEKGKVRRENTFALSSDGLSITETDVTPAPSPSKMTVVLQKM